VSIPTGLHACLINLDRSPDRPKGMRIDFNDGCRVNIPA
jgi:hypothetical protein